MRENGGEIGRMQKIVIKCQKIVFLVETPLTKVIRKNITEVLQQNTLRRKTALSLYSIEAKIIAFIQFMNWMKFAKLRKFLLIFVIFFLQDQTSRQNINNIHITPYIVYNYHIIILCNT